MLEGKIQRQKKVRRKNKSKIWTHQHTTVVLIFMFSCVCLFYPSFVWRIEPLLMKNKKNMKEHDEPCHSIPIPFRASWIFSILQFDAVFVDVVAWMHLLRVDISNSMCVFVVCMLVCDKTKFEYFFVFSSVDSHLQFKVASSKVPTNWNRRWTVWTAKFCISQYLSTYISGVNTHVPTIEYYIVKSKC